MHAFKEQIAICCCIGVFISWYLFTGYMALMSVQADARMVALLLLPMGVIVYFILKVIKQMKKSSR